MGITGGISSRRCTHSYQLLIGDFCNLYYEFQLIYVYQPSDSSVNHMDDNYGLLMLTAAKKLASAAHD